MLMRWTLPGEPLLSEFAADLDKNQAETRTPRTDVVDRGDSYELVVEMPGVSKDGLQVNLEGDVLLLHGTRKSAEAERVIENGRRAERPFEARFRLGNDVDRSKIRARLEDGLVYVALPRREEDKPRKIDVEIA